MGKKSPVQFCALSFLSILFIASLALFLKHLNQHPNFMSGLIEGRMAEYAEARMNSKTNLPGPNPVQSPDQPAMPDPLQEKYDNNPTVEIENSAIIPLALTAGPAPKNGQNLLEKNSSDGLKALRLIILDRLRELFQNKRFSVSVHGCSLVEEELVRQSRYFLFTLLKGFGADVYRPKKNWEKESYSFAMATPGTYLLRANICRADPQNEPRFQITLIYGSKIETGDIVEHTQYLIDNHRF